MGEGDWGAVDLWGRHRERRPRCVTGVCAHLIRAFSGCLVLELRPQRAIFFLQSLALRSTAAVSANVAHLLDAVSVRRLELKVGRDGDTCTFI